MDRTHASRLAARDLAVVWHPCTQMHDHETLPMLPIARAEGAWLYGHDGRRWLDAVSSWWTCLLGHRHPRIVAALKDQLDRLDHVMLAGFTHEPAIELAEELVRIAPRGRSRLSPLLQSPDTRQGPAPVGAAPAATEAPPILTRVFYADNGSSAIEVALKLSFHYWRNLGRGERTRFSARDTSAGLGATLTSASASSIAGVCVKPASIT